MGNIVLNCNVTVLQKYIQQSNEILKSLLKKIEGKEMRKKMKHGKLALAKKRRFKERNKGPHNSCSEPGQALRNNSIRKRSDGKDISLLFRLCGEREKINH